MPKIPSSYQVPLAIAVALHILLIAFLFIHIPTKNYRMPGPISKTESVKAVAVNARQINEQVAKIKRAERRKKAVERARVRRAEAKVAAAKRARIREQKRVAILKAQQRRIKKQRALEKKHLAQLKQKRQKALRAEQKALQDKLLKQQLSAEKNQLSKASTSQMRGTVNRYKAQILQAIGQNWLVPGGANKQLACIYLIQLAPGGVVLNVKLVHSSGNAALDRSARVAIYKASPLPVPKDAALFDNFRELRLTVSPKTVVTQ